MGEKLFEERADLYDYFYDYKDYRREAAFVESVFAEKADTDGRRTLVLGCGTGRHSAHLEEWGFNVTGVDKSRRMLEIARERSDAVFVQAALPDLGVAGPFDLVALPFNVVNYLAYADLRPSLEWVESILADGGVVVFDNCQLPRDEPSDVTVQMRHTHIGHLLRFERLEPIDDEHVRMESAVFIGNDRTTFFVDEWNLARYEDEYIERLLDDLGFSVDTYDGYHREEPDEAITVFVATR